MYKIRIQWDFFETCNKMGKVERSFCWHQYFVPWGLSGPAPVLYTCIKSWKNCIKSDFKDIFFKLATNERSDKTFLLTSNFVPWGCRPHAPGLYTCIKSWNMYKIRIQWDFFETCNKMGKVKRPFCWHQYFVPWGCLALPRCYIHVLNYEINCVKSDLKDIFWKLATNDRSDKMFLLISNFHPQGLSAPIPGLYACIKSWKNCIKSDFKEIFIKLLANDRSDKRFLLISIFCRLGLSAPDLRLYTFIKSWKNMYKVRGCRDSF